MKNRFKVIDVYPRGFCKGVHHAIELAKKARMDHPNEPISILGELVHNDDVSKALAELKIDTISTKGKKRIDLLDEVNEGWVIFSAHGISESVEAKAKAKGLQALNATCEDVLVTQNQIRAYLDQGYEVLYVGQKGHPEAEAVLDMDPLRITLVETGQALPSVQSDRLFVTNQTTMSILDIKETLTSIQARYPHALISDETCAATRLRQEAILKLPKSVDGIVIIGDKRSNNTKMLAKIAMNQGIKTVISIQNLRELDPLLLDQCTEVAITAGASTPKFIIDEVTAFIKAYAQDQLIRKEDYSIRPFL